MIGRIAAGVCAGLLFFFAALVLLAPSAVPTGRVVEVAVDAADVRPEIGHAFAFRVPKSFPDDSRSKSSLVLLEGDTPLTPHALHDSIRKDGKGLYSHWGRQVYFSASDNSDPRDNGRSYRYRATEALSSFWGVGAAVLGLLLAVLGRGNGFAILAGAGTGCMAAFLLVPADTMVTFTNAGVMALILAAWPVVCWHLGQNSSRHDWIKAAALAGMPLILAYDFYQYASIGGITWPGFLMLGGLVAACAAVSLAAFLAAARQFVPACGVMRRLPLPSPEMLVACLAAIALVPRFGLLALNWDMPPVSDAMGYDLTAHEFAQTLSIPERIDSMPGTIVANGLVYAAFGHYWVATKVFNLLLNLATGVLFAHAVRIGSGSRTAGMLTFLVFGVSVEVFRIDHVLLTETLFQFFIAALLWCLTAHAVWQSPRFAALGGAAAAGVILTRLQGAGLVAAAIAVLVLFSSGSIRRRFTAAVLMLATLLLLILPWGAWNAVHRGKFSFGSGQESSAFWLHNHPDAPHGLIHIAEMSAIWAREAGPNRTPPTPERVQELTRNTWAFYRQNPKVLLKRALDRQLNLIGLVPDSFFMQPQGWKPNWPSEVLSAKYSIFRLDKLAFLAAMVGMLLFRRDRISLISLLLFAGYAVPISLYSVPDQRIRWPVYMLMAMPYISLMSTAAAAVGPAPPVFRWRRMLVIVVAALAAWTALHLAWGKYRQFPPITPRGAIPTVPAATGLIPDSDLFDLPRAQWIGGHVVLAGHFLPYTRSYTGYPSGNRYQASPFLLDTRNGFYFFNLIPPYPQELNGSDALVSFDGCMAEKSIKQEDVILIDATVEGWALRLDNGRLANLWLRCTRAEKKR
jgi:4-amino-4-deoxy-L-arabinose transferase-like glycosyltransferase